MRLFQDHQSHVDGNLVALSNEGLSPPITVQSSVFEALDGAQQNFFALSNALSAPLYSDTALNAALTVTGSDDGDDESCGSDDQDDMPAAASSQNALHVGIGVGSISTAELSLGTGSQTPSGNGSDADSGDAGGVQAALAVEATALGTADLEVLAGSDDGQDGEADDDGGEEASATNGGQVILDVSSSLDSSNAELSVAVSGDTEASPPDQDEPDDTGPEDDGAPDDDGDASDDGGLLSGASSELVDAMSDIAALECGCDDDDTDASDDDGSGGGDGTGNGPTDTDDDDQGEGPDDADGPIVTDVFGDSGLGLHADSGDVSHTSVSLDAGSDEASADTDAGATESEEQGGSSSPDADPDPDNGGAPSQVSFGGELHAALSSVMADAQLSADASMPVGEDLSQLGAAIGTDEPGTDPQDGGEPDASQSGIDLGLEPSSHDECGCQSPLDSLAHGI